MSAHRADARLLTRTYDRIVGTITIAPKAGGQLEELDQVLAYARDKLGTTTVDGDAADIRSEIAYPLLRTRVINALEEHVGADWLLRFEMR